MAATRAIAPLGGQSERRKLQTAYDAAVRETHDRLMKAVQAGVRIAAGADIYLIVPGQTRGEASLSVLRSYLDAGLSRWRCCEPQP
jgi:hypothetical protein